MDPTDPHTSEELFERIKLIVRRCFKHNMFLKMEKSMLGIRKVKFFGYECEKGKFCIDQQRRADIQAIPPPMSRKGMYRGLFHTCYSTVQHDNDNIRLEQCLVQKRACSSGWH